MTYDRRCDISRMQEVGRIPDYAFADDKCADKPAAFLARSPCDQAVVAGVATVPSLVTHITRA